MIKAVIFDLDGLLLDTEPYWTIADNEILGREGYELTPELIRKRMGTGAVATVEIYRKVIPFKLDSEAFVKERRELVFKLMDEKMIVMEGAKEFIKMCFDKGISMAVATSGPHRLRMAKILSILGASDYISVFITGDQVKRAKPFPDIFLLASEQLGVKPEDCLVLEDAPAGVEAGKAAGMKTLGVNQDNETRDILKSSGADKVFRSITEIDISKI